MSNVIVRFPGANFEGDAEAARLFLGALGDREVRVLADKLQVTTGADLALLILERSVQP